MTELVYKIIDVDAQSFYMILVVTIVSIFLQREIVGSDLFTYISIPTFISAALISIYICRSNQWLIFGDNTIEVVVASTLGILATFMFFLLVLASKNALTGWHVNRVIRSRNLDRHPAHERANTR